MVQLQQEEFDALTLAIQAISKQEGVFILSERLARGFDLKFAKSAFVAIFADKFYYMSSTIYQMVGRANRNQDVQTGRVHCTFGSMVESVADWDFYLERERLGFNAFGLKILRALILIYNELTQKQRTELGVKLQGDTWSKYTRP